MQKRFSYKLFFFLSLIFIANSNCNKGSSSSDSTNNNGNNNNNNGSLNPDVAAWITSGDRTRLLQSDNTVLGFGTVSNNYPNINIDSAQRYQDIDGFGFTLTQGSAQVINQLPASQKASLLNELFGNTGAGINLSYLRIGIGATDLSSTVFSYDDMPAGQTDVSLDHFSIAADNGVISLLKEILLINPALKIMASPWSPPVWMKDNNSSVGGSLNTAYYNVYAQYFVKYIQAMQAEGINITAITPQNEPLNPNNNPSLSMTALQQADFIKNHLGPAFTTAGIHTKIVIYDHNCDRPDYPIAVLNDAAANPYIDGTAFHLYAGDINALLQLHSAFPSKHLYFTEQYTSSTGDFSGDLKWHLRNVIIGSMRNWSRIALEWNLANDPNYSPHTPGGCNTCLGGLTIGSSVVLKNVGYYIVAHASKFVPPGSSRIFSDNNANLANVAFLRPDGKKVLIVLNENNSAQTFNLKYKNKWTTPTIPANSVATYVW